MKIRNILAAASAASVAFMAFNRREQIAKEVKETKALIDDINRHKTAIQSQLTVLQSFKEPLAELSSDLQYKLQVYQQSIAGNLEEIQRIQAKHQTKDEA